MLNSRLWIQAVHYDLFSVMFFLLGLSVSILSLPLLGLGSKFTSYSPGFCVSRPKQYNTIWWEFNLFAEFFVFYWLIVWVDGVNRRGWCLAGGRECWLKGLHQIPRVGWLFYHSFHHCFTFIRLLICVKNIKIIILLLQKWWVEGWGVVNLCLGLGGAQVVGVIFFLFFVSFLCCC